MTTDAFSRRFQELIRSQDRAAERVLPWVDGGLMAQIKLCGGTALSRFYLQHRISYDLDFFVPEGAGFHAQALADRLASKVKIQGLALPSCHGLKSRRN